MTSSKIAHTTTLLPIATKGISTLRPEDYDLSAIMTWNVPRQIFCIDSNVNFPSDNGFLYQLFCNGCPRIMIFYINFFDEYDLKMSKID